MEWVLWALATTLVGAASYGVSAQLTQRLGLLVRALFTLLLAVGGVLGVLYGLGALSLIERWPLAAAVLFLHGGALAALMVRPAPRRALLGTARRDLRTLLEVGRELSPASEPAVFVLPVAALAFAVSCFLALRFPSWSWDCVWYHVPISNYVLQTRGNGWVDTNILYVNGYPRNVELLSTFSSVLLGSTRLDDAAQMPFAGLGVLAVAALCRRVGASRALSLSLGAMWLLTPAVCLQLHTTHADIAAGALFTAGIAFLSATPFSPLFRWATFLAFGLYTGSKVTGLFHLLLLAPLLAWQGVYQARQSPRPRRFLGELALQLLLVLALGGFSYVRGMARFGNPFWPVNVSVPVLGSLPGPIDPHTMAWPPAFFGAPGAFQHMLRQWFTPSNNYYPDVREGPFGVLFAWLTLPCFVLSALALPFGRDRRIRGFVALLGGLAVLVPVAWWGRYTLAMPAAALVSLAAIHRALRLRVLRVLLSAAAAFLCVASYAPAVQGYRVFPTLFADAATRAQDEQRLRAEIDWLWPYPAAQLRDRELRGGDAVAYEDGIAFLAEAWTEDLRNRVVYVTNEGDDAAYFERLASERVRWVSVNHHSRAMAAIRAHPECFQPIFQLPRSDAFMFRVVRSPCGR